MLLYYKDDTINNIASKLEFDNTSGFNRYLETLTGNTPNGIRKLYSKLMF